MRTNSRVWRGSKKQGIMLMLFAMLLAPLLALVGLTIDGGRIFFEKRRMQAAADGGAFGAAREILRGNDGFVVSAGRDDSKLNGFDNDAADITVTVNRPPSIGPNSGNNNAVEVIIDRPIPTTFLKVITRQNSTVRARAVAGVEPEWDPPCILALDPDASGAITISGNVDITVPDCTLVAKSNNPQALTVNGNVNVTTGGMGFGPAGGGYVQNGQGSVMPWPPYPVPGIYDPYEDVTAPNESLLTERETSKLQIGATPAAPLQPGIYDNGIKITGGDVILSEGIYVVDGFEVTGGSITGNGVMIYNRGTTITDNIHIGGNVTVDLHAIYGSQTVSEGGNVPDMYENFLFFNSRTAAVNNGGASDATLLGNSDSVYDGIMYFPTIKLNYGGTSTQDGSFAMIIANTIEFSGTPQLGADWSGAGRTPTLEQVSLLE